MELEDVVPRPEHVTRQVRWIAAEPGAVWDALHGVRLSGLPLTLVLSAARFLPVVLAGRGLGQLRDRPFLDALPVPRLASEPPSSVVFGGLLQPWRLSGGEPAPELDAATLRAWNAPGWVKVAMDFRLAPGRGGTELSSETRVAATDDASRAAFTRYWRVVRPGSTAVRWEVLTAVELRATGRLR
jgi:hypothetical protein